MKSTVFYFSLAIFCFGSSASPATTDTDRALNFERCHIKHNAVEIDAECANLTRPENPSKPGGKQIELFVAKLASSSSSPQEDAFTIIQGGPGGSSIDFAVNLNQLLDIIRLKRDVIVVDQRGTGRSNILQCDNPVGPGQVFEVSDAETIKQAKACLNKLAEHDLGGYTTSIAVQDLDAVRAAAGYQQLTIYGVSYGTRVAQHYLRRFPQQTRAIIIDGVVDIGLNLAGAEIARRSQDAFDGMVERCNTTPACKSEFGNIAEKFVELRQRLADTPVEIMLAHPLTGVSKPYTVTEFDLLGAVRLMPYSTEGLSLLPRLIAQAHAGDYTPLASQNLMTSESFIKGYASGMNNSVMCAEDAPFVEADAVAKAQDTYFGDMMINAMRITCQYWPRGPIDEDFRKSFKSDKPVLILSGETDPITPPSNGERAAAMFDNAKHLIVPSHGHGVIGRGCVPHLIRNFVANIDFDELKTDCIERERAMPFYVNSTGPKP